MRPALHAHALLILAPLALFLPLLFLDATKFFGNTDALFYVNILRAVTAQLTHGEFSRWLMSANAGLGSPVLYYYAPLPYYLSAILTLPFATLGASACYVIAMIASQIAAAYAARAWLARHFAPNIALLGALFYVLLPYKLIYIYLHVNLAQLWALVWLPLWLIAAEDLAEDKRRAIPAFAAFAALTCLSHQLTLLAFGAIPAAYALMLNPSVKTIARIALAALLGAAASAVYLLPMLDALPWLKQDQWFSGKFSVFENLNHIDTMLTLYYLILAACAWWMLERTRQKSTRWAQALFWLCALLVMTTLTLRLAAPLYQALRPLQYLQFPAARFHAGMLLGAVFAICIIFEHSAAGKISQFARPAYVWFYVGLFGAVTALRVAGVYFMPIADMNQPYIDQMHTHRLLPAVEYPTRWSALSNAELYKNREEWASKPLVSGKATVTRADPGDIAFTAQGPASVTVKQFYVPAWQSDIPLAPDKNGLITFTLPRGEHNVHLYLKPTHLANLLSLAAWAFIAALGLRARRPA